MVVWILLIWIWALVPIIFFSFSGSKLPGYILPAFPALALIAATVKARRWPQVVTAVLMIVVAIGVACARPGRVGNKLASDLDGGSRCHLCGPSIPHCQLAMGTGSRNVDSGDRHCNYRRRKRQGRLSVAWRA